MPNKIDHFAIGAADLDQGVAALESALAERFGEAVTEEVFARHVNAWGEDRENRGDDLELALRLAGKLADQPAGVQMPQWARDFEFLLLAELNELEAAIAIIQALLQSGSITDSDELRFLEQKLSDFQQELFDSRQIQ